MKKHAITALCSVMTLHAYAANAVPIVSKANTPHPLHALSASENQVIRFDFQFVSVSQIISLVYLAALKQPYVIDPSVLKDDRLVSFRFDASQGDLRTFWISFMDSLGFQIDTRNNVDYLLAKKAAEETKPVLDVFVYRPHYRQVTYLTGLLTPLFKTGHFTINRSVHAPIGSKTPQNDSPPTSATASIDQDGDLMVFEGTADELVKLRKILPQVDLPAGEVIVKAVVYEVTTSRSDGSAFGLALNILSGHFGVKLGSSSALSNSISFKSSSIDAVFSALAEDARFNAISTPSLRVKSGTQARLTVGQDVPTLGAINYSQNGGQPVQSVEYRSSGVILNLSPVVRESTVDMTIDQQISDFAKTETGVNNSPTLTKREVSTTVSVTGDELILIGGLTQDKNTDTHSGFSFLPQLFHSKSNAGSRTELLLLLQVQKI